MATGAAEINCVADACAQLVAERAIARTAEAQWGEGAQAGAFLSNSRRRPSTPWTNSSPNMAMAQPSRTW